MLPGVAASWRSSSRGRAGLARRRAAPGPARVHPGTEQDPLWFGGRRRRRLDGGGRARRWSTPSSWRIHGEPPAPDLRRLRSPRHAAVELERPLPTPRAASRRPQSTRTPAGPTPWRSGHDQAGRRRSASTTVAAASLRARVAREPRPAGGQARPFGVGGSRRRRRPRHPHRPRRRGRATASPP